MEWYYAFEDEQRGPVSEQELLGLIDQGVVTPQTLIWCASMTDWRTYDEVRAMGSLLPTISMGTVACPDVAVADRNEPLAIASLVLAIVSWGCGFVVALAAVICGHIALSRINASGGRLSGRPLALGGLVIGYIVLAINALGVLFILGAMFASAT